jgi:hypothetical protein
MKNILLTEKADTKQQYKQLVILAWLLNLFDCVITVFAVNSGLASEANGIMAAIMGSMFIFIALKIGLFSVIARRMYVTLYCRKTQASLWITVALYMFVIINNCMIVSNAVIVR